MSVQYIPPYTPLLYSKTGVCRGIPIFIIFGPKHLLWVLNTHYCVPTINVLSKNKKNIFFFLLKCSIFTAEKKLLYIAWTSFHNG